MNGATVFTFAQSFVVIELIEERWQVSHNALQFHLGTVQQLATVTISSSVNVLIVGVLLVTFVIIAPNGIVGLVQNMLRKGRS